MTIAVEFVENPEPRCPVALIVDCSRSMAGEKLRQLAAGLAAFKWHLQQDDWARLRVEVAVVAYGGTVRCLNRFQTVDRWRIPELVAEGETPMGAALDQALDLIEARKQALRAAGLPYFRPWGFLITDGEPSDRRRLEAAAQRVAAMELSDKLTFFAVGVEGADFAELARITAPGRPPIRLRGLEFSELFVWLSSSIGRVSSGRIGLDQAPLPLGRWAEAAT